MVFEWIENTFNPRHIVIIDDDGDFLSMIQEVLERKKYKVTAARSLQALGGLDDLDQVDAFFFDVFIKPPPSGPELAILARKAGFECPICFLTGHASTISEEEKLRNLTYDVEFLQKPISSERLLQMASDLTGR